MTSYRQWLDQRRGINTKSIKKTEEIKDSSIDPVSTEDQPKEKGRKKIDKKNNDK